MKRIDLVFSVWIFLWFLAYLVHLVPISPKFAILLALVFNIWIFARILAQCPRISQVALYIAINALIKFIPLWYTWNDTITLYDIVATFALFFVYLLWLAYNNTCLTHVYDKVVSLFH